MLEDCLRSLQAQTTELEVVVVDNGSTDGSQQLVKNDFKDVHLIELPENTGFTGGVNTGIEYAIKKGAEYVLLLNNDAVADKTWAHELLKTAGSHSEAGIVTSKFMRIDKKHIDSTGDFYTVWGLPFPRGRNEIDKGQYDDAREVFGGSGGASLYRTSMLKEIGLFDQDYFAYFEDVDISFRAQLAGWRVLYEPAAIAYHHVGATSSKMGDFARFHMAKNFMLVYARNMPTKLYLKYLPLFSLQFIRFGLSSTIHGKPHIFLRGVGSALRLHGNNVRKRKEIQSSRKVEVAYIDSILSHHLPPRVKPISE